MASLLKVKMEGLEDLVKRAGSKTVFISPLKEAITRATMIVEREAETHVPRLTGRLAGSITHRIDETTGGSGTSGAGVRGVVILKSPESSSGFPYGYALDTSKTKRRFHFRGGGRTGKLTRRWFSGALRVRRADVNALIAKAQDEIQRRWGS